MVELEEEGVVEAEAFKETVCSGEGVLVPQGV